MSEWVKGSEVDWEGWAEYFAGHDQLVGKPTFIRMGFAGDRVWWDNANGKWYSVKKESHGIKFRRPVDPDGERWRAVMAKLKELSHTNSHHLRLYDDGSSSFYQFEMPGSAFTSIAQLDAYLAKPKPAPVTINGNTHSLLPGEAVVDGEFVVTRKEKP